MIVDKYSKERQLERHYIMTKHMKIFASMADYEAWIGEDQYLPHACFVQSIQTPITEITKQTPGRVYFSRIGDEFI